MAFLEEVSRGGIVGEVKVLAKNNFRSSFRFRAVLLILLSFSLFFVLYITLGIVNAPSGTVIEWNQELGKYYEFHKPSKIVLNGTFEFDGINNYIVFQKVLATKMDVYINGYHVVSFGDGTGNLWPRSRVVRVPKVLLQENKTNKIKVTLYGLVGAGIYGQPYATIPQVAVQRAALIDLFRNNITLIGIGMTALILYLLIIAYQSLTRDEKLVYRYLMIASSFMIASLIQFVYRESSGSPEMYLIFEELGVTASPFIITYLFFAIRTLSVPDKAINRKLKAFLKYFPVVLLALALFSTKVKYIHIASTLSELYSLALIFSVLFFVFRYKILDFVFPISFLVMTGIETLYVLSFNKSNELMIHYGRFVFLVYVGTVTMGRFKKISASHERLKNENLIDSLTGVYNRKVIDLVPKKGTFVLLDLDGFKLINDKYGHVYGDQVLKRFAEIVKSHIRSEDYFIRLGGDEFCLIFNSVEEKDVHKIIIRLYNDCRNELNLGFSYGTAPFDDFDKAYETADKVMYEKKMEKYAQELKKREKR